MKQTLPAPESIETRNGPRLFYFRHAQALYGAIKDKLLSADPRGPIDIDTQPDDDLSPEGHVRAQAAAEAFFSRLIPGKDIVAIVASTQMRALQTARAFLDEARQRGFTVVEHEKTGSEIAEKVGGRHIRSLETLSHGYADALPDAVFNPPSQLPEINWKAVPPEYRTRWDRARAKVLADDKGNWGANFFAHSEEIEPILPGVRSSKDLFAKRYKALVRQAQVALRSPEGERVNILAFGHENMVGIPLERDTGDHALPNCEGVEMIDGKLQRIQI